MKNIITFTEMKVMMDIKRTTFKELQLHCSIELLSLLQDINIDISNQVEDIWEISSYLDNTQKSINIMKIAYAFEKIGGTLLNNGEPSQYVTLTNKLGNVYDKIRLFWIHNEANGVLPIYDLGILEVPQILPKYAIKQGENGTWDIEKLMFGEYVPIKNEIYPSEGLARKRAEQLNDNDFAD